jgi:putative peptidoglycan lipid II flippase
MSLKNEFLFINKENGNMSKVTTAALGLMIATMLSKILGFGRELALASAYGASSYSDAYLVALNIPMVIFAAIGTAIATSYIPLYCDIREKSGEENSIKFTNNLISVIVILTTLATIIGVVCTKPIVKLFAVGFEGETLKLAISFTRIMLLSMAFTGINYIITAYLQVKGNFMVPGFISVPKNLIIIGSILASAFYGDIYILIYGTLVAMCSELFFQLPFAFKKGFKYKPYLEIKDENVKKLIFLVAPVFIGVSVNQINTMIDRTLASSLVEGSISALNYGNKLIGFILGLFVMTISTVIYPMLSKLASQNDIKGLKEATRKAVNIMIILIIPVTAGALVLSEPIVRLLFERGSFDARATSMTASALFFYSIGIIGFGLKDVLSRVFYSLQDTKTPMINSVMAVVLNIVLNLILVKYMAHSGLALATSISSIICIILLFISLKKKIGDFEQDKILKVTFKTILASIIMSIITKLSYGYLDGILGNGFMGQALVLGISVLIGILVYLGLVILFKVNELDIVIDMVKSKLRKK